MQIIGWFYANQKAGDAVLMEPFTDSLFMMKTYGLFLNSL